MEIIRKKSNIWISTQLKINTSVIYKVNFKFKGEVEYSFSHFKLQTKVYFQIIEKSNFPKSKWIKKEKIEKSGLPTVMKKIVKVAI